MCRTQNFSGSVSLVSTDSRTSSVFPLINLLHFQINFLTSSWCDCYSKECRPKGSTFQGSRDSYAKSGTLSTNRYPSTSAVSSVHPKKFKDQNPSIRGASPVLFSDLWASFVRILHYEGIVDVWERGQIPSRPSLFQKINLSNAGRMPGRAGLQGRWWWRQTGWEDQMRAHNADSVGAPSISLESQHFTVLWLTWHHWHLCCCSSVTQLCLIFCDLMDCSTSGFPVLHYLLEFAQTHVHWVYDVNQPSHPLSPLLRLPSNFPSIRVFSNESALQIRWPKYWSFSISSSNEYSGLISFRIDWFDLPAVQRTLKSLLQHHSSKNGPTLTSVHDYWKNQSFDYMDLCWQSDISAF